MSLNFYCGLSNRQWNHHPAMPGDLACVSPICGKGKKKFETWVNVPSGTQVIQDSGAFSDGPASRLNFANALDRQIAHAEKHKYTDKITHRASYDLLIDETWIDGNRLKRRWSESDADRAVETTISAAEYIARNGNQTGLVLSAQGVTPSQYFECTQKIIEYIRPNQDILGLGGWCVVGIYRSLMSSFLQTINLVIPYAESKGIKRIHIWGVLYPPALGRLAWLCDQYEIELSTDSAGPAMYPVWGQWGYAEWQNRNYQKPPATELGLHRASHVQATRVWLGNVHCWDDYKQSESVYIPNKKFAGGHKQLALW